jgi:hypothetical protein
MTDAATIGSVGVGVCAGHPPFPPIPMVGIIVTGSSTVMAGNIGCAYNTSIVLGSCGHIGIIVTSSSSVSINNLDKSRIGSTFVGIFTGIITTGDSSVIVGG